VPAILKLLVVIAIFIAPVIAFLALFIRWENRRNQRHLRALATELGLKAGTSIGNRLFEFPSALGYVDGYPVWLGTISGRRRAPGSTRYILLQLVVGREEGAPLDTVGPHDLDALSTSVPYAELEQKLAKDASFSDLLAARSGLLDGGKHVEVTDRAVVRTFATRSVANAAWARRIAASTRVMARYARYLEQRELKKAA